VKWLKSLIAKHRIWKGYCPRCKSEAPEIGTCHVCEGYRWSDFGYPSNATKQTWWNKWKEIP
jgi:hypothetical protein